MLCCHNSYVSHLSYAVWIQPKGLSSTVYYVAHLTQLVMSELDILLKPVIFANPGK